MPSTTVVATISAQLPTSLYLIPNHLKSHQNARRNRNHVTLSLSPTKYTKIPIRDFHVLTLPNPHNFFDSISNHSLFLQSLPSTDYNNSTNRRNPDPRNQKQSQRVRDERNNKGLFENKNETSRVLFTNMWWADVKAALGQRVNLEAIYSTFVFAREPKLALPHISVQDIRYIDWGELRKSGFKGVVFDKDNTITAPYCLTPWPPLSSSLERCKSEFGNAIAVFSNSAGLYEYDHDGSKAKELEKASGIRVIRHRLKKPAGTAEEIEKHFGCESSQLIMVGDRPFTDIVYGNRNGFLTILTDPFSLTQEPFIVQQVRKLETSFVNHWRERGFKPPTNKLLADPMQCVIEPPTRIITPMIYIPKDSYPTHQLLLHVIVQNYQILNWVIFQNCWNLSNDHLQLLRRIVVRCHSSITLRLSLK